MLLGRHEIISQFITEHYFLEILGIEGAEFPGNQVVTRMGNPILASEAMKYFTEMVNHNLDLGTEGIMKISFQLAEWPRIICHGLVQFFFALLKVLNEWKVCRDDHIQRLGFASISFVDPKFIVYASANWTLGKNPFSPAVLNRCILTPVASITGNAPLGDASQEGMDKLRQLFLIGDRPLNVALLGAVAGSERGAGGGGRGRG